uniref:Putative secreted protein n=1 Tax=Anopheles triannulatus TaxID=58253 RepID=A0A2M4B1V1_9DIPT
MVLLPLLIKALVLSVLRPAQFPILHRHRLQVLGVMSRFHHQVQERLATLLEEKSSVRMWENLPCLPLASTVSWA